MKFRNVFAALLVLVGLFPFAPLAFGFALLGPFAPWMEETNDLRQLGDIGGPMEIGSGYRWNVPIVTYGFDQSFLDYFGTNGVQAVEDAFQILNDLPAASDLVLTNYPFESQGTSYQAQALSLYDLKSFTLALLLEQLGLTSPTRYVFTLRRWDPIFLTYPYSFDWPDWVIPYYITERNYDPETLAASQIVNGAGYDGEVLSMPQGNYVAELLLDPMVQVFSSVTDAYGGFIISPQLGGKELVLYFPGLQLGGFYTGLTRDDVGGLRYLLSADNVNYEKLPLDVRTSGSHRNHTGNGAWRPGVEKITFVRQPYDRQSGKFRPFRHRFTDAYLENDVLMHQRVEREVRQPDFLFYAADTGENEPYTSTVIRTGTTNWQNNAAFNGNSGGEGPGIIQPPIKITFQKLGPTFIINDGIPTLLLFGGWGTFDGTTNLPVVYPENPQNNIPFTVRLRFIDGTNFVYNHTWHLPVPIGGIADLQVSTNQISWTSVATATNGGAVAEWDYYAQVNPPKFFRVIPQSVPEPNH